MSPHDEDERLREMIRQELERVGLDPDKAEDLRADMVFQRRSRLTAEKLALALRLAVLGAILGGVFEAVRFAITGKW